MHKPWGVNKILHLVGSSLSVLPGICVIGLMVYNAGIPFLSKLIEWRRKNCRVSAGVKDGNVEKQAAEGGADVELTVLEGGLVWFLPFPGGFPQFSRANKTLGQVGPGQSTALFGCARGRETGPFRSLSPGHHSASPDIGNEFLEWLSGDAAGGDASTPALLPPATGASLPSTSSDLLMLYSRFCKQIFYFTFGLFLMCFGRVLAIEMSSRQESFSHPCFAFSTRVFVPVLMNCCSGLGM